ncbi:MAG: DUF938 domain-containing protein [Reyranellaceae bacterium]
MSDARRHAPATLRNRDAILAVLQRALPQKGVVLEIASGTGEHAAFIAPRLPGTLAWQPSDFEAEALAGIDAHADGSPRILKALRLDVTAPAWPLERAQAMFCANMIHIAPWVAAEGLFAGAGRLLPSGAPLVLYGPFKRHGRHTAPSNEAFDQSLKAQDPAWGVRCLESEVMPLAERHGLALDETVQMPANNLSVIFRRS